MRRSRTKGRSLETTHIELISRAEETPKGINPGGQPEQRCYRRQGRGAFQKEFSPGPDTAEGARHCFSPE